MRLERRLRAALWLLRRSGGGRRLHTMTPDEARAALRAQTTGARAAWLHGRLPAVAEVRDINVAGATGPLPARVYQPLDARGALVFFHGGGFVTGGIDEADVECRRIAVVSGRTVCSIGYRLAPEHRFPAAVDDAAAAFQWAVEHCSELGSDRGHIGVGGESAGGTLAAAVAQMARHGARLPVDRQLLIYAGFDPAGSYPSRESPEPTPVLSAADIDWSHGHYFSSPADQADPRASPIRGQLTGLPPALIIVAEHDPLRDEGVAYAHALRSAGSQVDLRSYPRQPHGFLLLGRLSGQSRRAFEDIGQFLRI